MNSAAGNKKHFIFTLIATTLFISTYYLLLPVLPLYMQGMGGSKFKIGLIMGLFSASSLFLRPLAGQASDRKGPVKIMKWAIFLYFITPFFYFVQSFLLVSIAQLFYGFTIGAFTISSATVITTSVSLEKVGQAIGIHSIALILAKGLAPTLGTLVHNAWGLYPLIAITLLASLAALLVTWRLPEIKPASKPGSITFRQVFTYRMVWVCSLVLLSVTLTFGTIMTMLPLLALERNISQYSMFFTVNTLAVVATRLFTGKQNRLTLEALIAFSLLFIFLAVMLVSGSYSLTTLIVAAIIYGLGYGAVYPALSTMVVLRTPGEIRGSAFGLFTAAFDIGVTLGSVWGGFSEYLGFKTIYFLASFAPIMGLICFVVFLHGENVWNKILMRDAAK